MSAPARMRGRSLRHLPVEHARALAGEASRRGLTVNALILQLIYAYIEKREALGADDDLLSLDPARAVQRLGDVVAADMVGEAKRLVAWVRAHQRAGRWPEAAAAWIEARERMQELETEAALAREVAASPGWTPWRPADRDDAVQTSALDADDTVEVVW